SDDSKNDCSAVSERYVREFAPLLGGSPPMRAIRAMVERVAVTDAAVLLRGESGVGKDLIARAIHAASARSDGPFIKVNCAAIPHGLIESELFGHEKGDLPLALQAKVLHVLQDLTFSRVGGHVAIEVDVRIVAATNRDLEQAIMQRQFREDLYYRLNVVDITVPPLRERQEEILPLARAFLAAFNAQYNSGKELTPEIERRLVSHSWPGNVRELENIVRRFVVLSDVALVLDALVDRRPRSGIE